MINILVSKEILARLTLRILNVVLLKDKIEHILMSGKSSWIPFMACGIVMLFIFTESPIQALISVVVFMVVQTVEGNVVYPRVVGSSVGLPTALTLATTLIGGNLFGLVGMIFFTPIFAVIYRLVKEWMEKHEQAAPVVAVGGIIDEEN